MKRLLICVVLCLASICAKAQLNSTNQYINGIWGGWKSVYPYSYSSSPDFQATGKPSDLIIYPTGSHPSNYICRLRIFGFVRPDKKTRRQHYRSGERYFYKGILEWSVPKDVSPSVKNFVATFPSRTAAIEDGRYYKSNVEVGVYPTINYPYGHLTLNIYFVDNPGMGIGLSINVKKKR